MTQWSPNRCGGEERAPHYGQCCCRYCNGYEDGGETLKRQLAAAVARAEKAEAAIAETRRRMRKKSIVQTFGYYYQCGACGCGWSGGLDELHADWCPCRPEDTQEDKSEVSDGASDAEAQEPESPPGPRIPALTATVKPPSAEDAVRRIEKLLREEGEDLIRNGKALAEHQGQELEGRARVMAGVALVEVSFDRLRREAHEVHMANLLDLKERIEKLTGKTIEEMAPAGTQVDRSSVPRLRTEDVEELINGDVDSAADIGLGHGWDGHSRHPHTPDGYMAGYRIGRFLKAHAAAAGKGGE